MHRTGQCLAATNFSESTLNEPIQRFPPTFSLPVLVLWRPARAIASIHPASL